MRHTGILGTLTISAAGTASTELNPIAALGALTSVTIYAPAALTAAVTLQASWLEAPTASDWRNVTYITTVITLAAGAAVVVPTGAFKAIRVLSAGAEAAQRDFLVVGQFEMV